MKDVTVLVLAAGIGKRFWPLETDKNLFPFLGKHLIEHALFPFREKFSKLVIVTNRTNNERIKKINFGMPQETVIQDQPQGMASAVLSAKDHLTHGPLLVMIADHLVEETLINEILKKADTSVFGILPAWETTKYFPGGYLVVKGDKVVSIMEKPGEGNEPSKYVYVSGAYIKDGAELVQEISRTTSEADDVFEKALTALMQKNGFAMVPFQGSPSALKYSWQVLDVMDFLFAHYLQSHRGKNIEIKQNVVIQGSVYIEDNVKIFENTKIVGPCFIGENTIIGNSNIIRQSHIGANCVTGFGTDITRSYIGDDCWFHTNYIGDSVLEKNISLGSGAVTANLRLNEGEIGSLVDGEKIMTGRNKLGSIIGSNVRMGVNASIMPGVKIGADSFVGAGVVLDKDLGNNSYCALGRANYTVVPNTSPIVKNQREGFKKGI